ncbi:hypothetical protein [Thiocystis violacea]|uniref:hypothetical protein n=1 Tax=Thiocystis violacea TaxID=13725 RepID=UPI00190475CC|nr:hypothetical protein [Thiocystis violacea]MBK1721697.1 hypothetical protein [Thiocystis violacea]
MLAALLCGCQSTTSGKKTGSCEPAAGMTTAQLATCGCFSTDKQARYAITGDADDDNQATQSITIVTYFCPLSTAGMARVVVVNGTAKEVFR